MHPPRPAPAAAAPAPHRRPHRAGWSAVSPRHGERVRPRVESQRHSLSLRCAPPAAESLRCAPASPLTRRRHESAAHARIIYTTTTTRRAAQGSLPAADRVIANAGPPVPGSRRSHGRAASCARRLLRRARAQVVTRCSDERAPYHPCCRRRARPRVAQPRPLPARPGEGARLCAAARRQAATRLAYGYWPTDTPNTWYPVPKAQSPKPKAQSSKLKAQSPKPKAHCLIHPMPNA